MGSLDSFLTKIFFLKRIILIRSFPRIFFGTSTRKRSSAFFSAAIKNFHFELFCLSCLFFMVLNNLLQCFILVYFFMCSFAKNYLSKMNHQILSFVVSFQFLANDAMQKKNKMM